MALDEMALFFWEVDILGVYIFGVKTNSSHLAPRTLYCTSVKSNTVAVSKYCLRADCAIQIQVAVSVDIDFRWK